MIMSYLIMTGVIIAFTGFGIHSLRVQFAGSMRAFRNVATGTQRESAKYDAMLKKKGEKKRAPGKGRPAASGKPSGGKDSVERRRGKAGKNSRARSKSKTKTKGKAKSKSKAKTKSKAKAGTKSKAKKGS